MSDRRSAIRREKKMLKKQSQMKGVWGEVGRLDASCTKYGRAFGVMAVEMALVNHFNMSIDDKKFEAVKECIANHSTQLGCGNEAVDFVYTDYFNRVSKAMPAPKLSLNNSEMLLSLHLHFKVTLAVFFMSLNQMWNWSFLSKNRGKLDYLLTSCVVDWARICELIMKKQINTHNIDEIDKLLEETYDTLERRLILLKAKKKEEKMRIIVCDKCGKKLSPKEIYEIGPERADENGNLVESDICDVIGEEIGEYPELCRECEIKAFKLIKAWTLRTEEEKPVKLSNSKPQSRVTEKVEEKAESTSEKKTKYSTKYDWGKVKALKDAGWTWKQISGELFHDESAAATNRIAAAWAQHKKKEKEKMSA